MDEILNTCHKEWISIPDIRYLALFNLSMEILSDVEMYVLSVDCYIEMSIRKFMQIELTHLDI